MAVRIALIGDENVGYPSHREINAVRAMLGDDVVTEWVATDGDRVRHLEAFAEDAEAEVLELPSNRFFMLTLFQPHVGALAGKPLHPLLREFVRCARENAAVALSGGR